MGNASRSPRMNGISSAQAIVASLAFEQQKGKDLIINSNNNNPFNSMHEQNN